MQIIHFKKFCVPASTGTSKGDKLLKIPSDSISDGVMFKNFLRGICMPKNPLVLACFACLCALHIIRVHIPVSATSTMMTDLALFKSLDAPLAHYRYICNIVAYTY